MEIEDYIKQKKAFIFKFDNVLYPEKDYLLQVYYLFSEFIEYTEQLTAAPILDFMQKEYFAHGSDLLFEKTAKHFQLDAKYKHNFLLLHQNARLPLKLLLFKQSLKLLQDLVLERKEIFLLVDGDPEQQLNKIKQMEWNGLEKYLKVYFSAEFAPLPSTESIDFIKAQHHLRDEELLLISDSETDFNFSAQIGVDFFPVTKLF